MMLSKFDIANDFPALLGSGIDRSHLVYLDSAATTLKPNKMTDALMQYYQEYSANIHRGTYEMSIRASKEFEQARHTVRRFFNIEDGMPIFTQGTTHGINMCARMLCPRVNSGDYILTTQIEHHSNILPWQNVCKKRGCTLQFCPLHKNGRLDYKKLYSNIEQYQPKVFAVSGMSNVTGYVPDLPKLVEAAHAVGSLVVVDGAQLASHNPVDLRKLDCDVFCCSGHKLYGPTGIGLLLAKQKLLEEFVPDSFGGGMVTQVDTTGHTLAMLPERLEGGTPHIAGAIGLGASLQYLEEIGMDSIAEHERALSDYLAKQLQALPYIKLIGHNEDCTAICSFTIDGTHSHDAGSMLDSLGIAVRVGYHCAQPMLQTWNISGTIRASFGLYNTTDDVDALIEGIERIYAAA